MPDIPVRGLGDLAGDDPARLPVGRSVIVVIGIDEYAYHPMLTNAVNDARSVLKVFQHCSFEELPGAPSLFNGQATLESMTALVSEQLLRELKSDDSLILFYAGHGTTQSRDVPDPDDATKTVTFRTGYLIPADARENKPSDWLRLDSFLDDVSKLPARHVLVILDACKSGFALSDKFIMRSRGLADGTLVDLASRMSRHVMTSAMHDQTAMDGGGTGNSLFTETLVDAVENLEAPHNFDECITSTELFSYVRKEVGDRADRVYHLKQTPDYGRLPLDGRGELVISLKGDKHSRDLAAENLQAADHIYQLGWLSGDGKRFDSACRYYKEAYTRGVEGKMAFPQARLGLGKALLAAGQAGDAAGQLAQLVRDEGAAASAEMYLYLGLAHAKRGDYALAAEAMRASLKIGPDGLDAAWIAAYADWLAQAGQPASAQKLALLIGIDRYDLKTVPRLHGCASSADRLMKPALIAHGGFSADNVTVLKDSDATRAGVINELQSLKNRATLSDSVIVHYSGHSIPASQLDQMGKYNQENVYLILHDTNDKPGYLTNGITADELHQIMQDIPAGRKTLILDTHASERLIELARREGSYALILASDTGELAYECQLNIAGESVMCGLLTGALCLALANADAKTLCYGEWVGEAIRICEQVTSDRMLFAARQTPYFSGIKKRRVFGTDDIFTSVFEFSQRHEWPELTLEDLTRLYATFCHTISVPHPHAHHAFGRALMSKGAGAQAIVALKTAAEQAGDAAPEIILTLARSLFRLGQYSEALAPLRRYAPQATETNRPIVEELTCLLEQLTESRKHALLVGIDRYQCRDVPGLAGARNDVTAIKEMLLKRWGIQAQNTVELVDEQATRASILAQFKTLADAARREPGLFYFAGRGSQGENNVPTLVPNDGRQADVDDITLEDLSRLAGQEATNLTLILDTNFSSSRPEAARTLPPRRKREAAAELHIKDAGSRLNALTLGGAVILSSK